MGVRGLSLLQCTAKGKGRVADLNQGSGSFHFLFDAERHASGSTAKSGDVRMKLTLAAF